MKANGQTQTYRATLYLDAEDADWQTRPYAYEIVNKEVTSSDTLHIRMASGGGLAVELTIQDLSIIRDSPETPIRA